MNDVAADKMGLQPTAILEEVGEDNGNSVGIGKVGMLSEPVSVQQLAEKVKEAPLYFRMR